MKIDSKIFNAEIFFGVVFNRNMIEHAVKYQKFKFDETDILP